MKELFDKLEFCYFRYIYGGIFSLEEYDTSNIVKTLIAAGGLSLKELVDHIQSFY